MSFLLTLFPGKIWVYLATILAIFASGATTAWKIQEWRQANKENQYAQAQLLQERSDAKTAIRRAEAVIVAQNADTVRQSVARRDSASNRALVDSLHDDIAGYKHQLATAPLDAVRNYVGAANLILDNCTARYSEMASAAQGHFLDTVKLQESWPK